MKKTSIAGIALAASLSVPAAASAVPEAAPQAEAKAQSEAAADLIECPLTGELISPCCCPERQSEASGS